MAARTSSAWPSGFDFGENLQQRLVRANQEGGPLNAHDFLPVHIFFFQHVKLFADFFVYIGKEGIRQVVLCLELRWPSGVSREMPSTMAPAALEFFEGVAEAAGLDRAARSVGSGIKEEDDGLAGEILEVNGIFLVILKRKIGNFLVEFHKSSFSGEDCARQPLRV